MIFSENWKMTPLSLLQLGRGENNFSKLLEKLPVKVFAFIKIASCRLLYRHFSEKSVYFSGTPVLRNSTGLLLLHVNRYYSLGYMQRLSIFYNMRPIILG